MMNETTEMKELQKELDKSYSSFCERFYKFHKKQSHISNLSENIIQDIMDSYEEGIRIIKEKVKRDSCEIEAA